MARWPGWVASFAVVALDQGLKAWVAAFLAPGQSHPVLGDFLRLARVHNSGAAFGLFPEGKTAFLVTSLVVASILFLYLLLARPQGLRAWGGALVLGGAVGNLLDRARLGYVVDLFSVGRFPVFNVADAALVLGAGLWVLGLWRRSR